MNGALLQDNSVCLLCQNVLDRRPRVGEGLILRYRNIRQRQGKLVLTKKTDHAVGVLIAHQFGCRDKAPHISRLHIGPVPRFIQDVDQPEERNLPDDPGLRVRLLEDPARQATLDQSVDLADLTETEIPFDEPAGVPVAVVVIDGSPVYVIADLRL